MSDNNEDLMRRLIDAALRAEYEAIWGQPPEVEGNVDLYFQSPDRRRVAGLAVEAIWQALMCRLMSDESAGGAPSVPGGAGATNVEALVKILDMREWWEGDVYTLARHLDGQGVAAALPSEQAIAERIAKQMWEEEIGDPPWEIVSAETRLSKTQRVQKVLALRDAVRGAPPTKP